MLDQVVRGFDPTEIAVRLWVKQADLGEGSPANGRPSDEEAQLAALRPENH